MSEQDFICHRADNTEHDIQKCYHCGKPWCRLHEHPAGHFGVICVQCDEEYAYLEYLEEKNSAQDAI